MKSFFNVFSMSVFYHIFHFHFEKIQKSFNYYQIKQTFLFCQAKEEENSFNIFSFFSDNEILCRWWCVIVKTMCVCVKWKLKWKTFCFVLTSFKRKHAWLKFNSIQFLFWKFCSKVFKNWWNFFWKKSTWSPSVLNEWNFNWF